MKNSNKKDPDKTTSNGKGDLSPKPKQISCKCTDDCCCPNSNYHKDTKKQSIKENPESAENLPPIVRKKVSVPELEYSKCPCADQKEKYPKSKIPCTKEQDCSCTLPTNTLSLRHKVADLENALKVQGRGKKRNTKNIQRKSIQISEVFEDPETKKKSIVTLTEKSQVKIAIKSFCDDTRTLEKNKKKKKKKKRKKSSGGSSKSSTSNKEKKQKEKKPKKEKQPKEKKPTKEKKQKTGGFCGCFRKKPKNSISSKSSYPSKNSDVSVLYQTIGGQPCKGGPCLGIKAYSKTERVGEGIVNTNTVVFPDNFTGNLNQLGGCETCKGLIDQLDQQTKEIGDIRRSLSECLKILKSNGQAVYMMSDMTERTNPNYYTVYSHASNKYHKKLQRDGKASEHSYDPEHKVRDWITHRSSKHLDHEDKSHSHKHNNQASKGVKDQDTKDSANNKGNRTPDKFDSELEEYLKICRHEYQVYKSSKEAKSPKVRTSKSKGSKTESKKRKKSKKGSDKNETKSLGAAVPIQGPQCDRLPVDCKCGPDCEHLGVQTSNVSTDPSKKSRGVAKKSKRDSKFKDKKKKSKGDVNSTGSSSTIVTDKSEPSSVLSADKALQDLLDKDAKGKDVAKDPIRKKPGCMRKLLSCFLCRPY